MASQNAEINMNAPIRLDKFLSASGNGTRSEVKKILKQGQVLVNGAVEKHSEIKIIPAKDLISVNGVEIQFPPFAGIMFYKPAGCVTAASDPVHKTVMDYIRHDRKEELFPVGRLDIDTEGLLFMINDGALGHRMLSPRHHVEKIYYVKTDLEVTREAADRLECGVDIGEKQLTLPAKVRLISENESEITICEGKFHQVKRMYAAIGREVIYLKRISMAGVALDESLLPGTYRDLSQKEIDQLRLCMNDKDIE